jgi:hypothetical protein
MDKSKYTVIGENILSHTPSVLKLNLPPSGENGDTFYLHNLPAIYGRFQLDL